MQISRLLFVILITSMFIAPSWCRAQPSERRGPIRKFIERFDEDGDGRLDAGERAAARRFLQELRGRPGGEAQAGQTVEPGKTDLYKLASGPFTPVEKDLTLRDAGRGKDIPVRVNFPKESGQFPVIIFSHGAMGSRDGADPLADHWASHGYIVIRPTHGDSLKLLDDEQKSKIKSIIAHVNSKAVSEQWDDRPLDVSFIIDSLGDIAEKIDGLGDRMDVQRVGHGGHSFGAHTALMLAGMKLYHPFTGQSVQMADDRVQCSVMISPQGTGTSIKPSSFEDLDGPALMITGDKDGSPIRGQEDKFGQWRAEAFKHAPKGDKYLLWIKDADHSFGGINGQRLALLGSPNADHVYYVKSTTLAFWDAYLKNDAAARRYLQSDHVNKTTEKRAVITAK